MKITDLKTFFSGINHYVKIFTDEGITGLGECTLNTRQLAVDGTLKHIAPVLIGQDPFRTEHIWQDIYRGTFWRGGPVLLSALSAIDIALWDIKGKALNTPVYNLLGGKCRDKVRTYASIGGATPGATAESALYRVANGHTVLRMCMDTYSNSVYEQGQLIHKSAKYVEAVRHAVGDDVEIIFECHTRLSPARAVEQANAIAEYHPFFIEDPLRSDSPEEFRHLRSHTNVPLGTGEKLGTIWDYKTLIEEDLIDYIRTDICNCGGISSMRKIAAYGETHYMEMVPHGVPHVGFMALLHLDFATPNFNCQEDWFSGSHPDHLDYDASYSDGFITLTDRPGLGIELIEENLKPFTPVEHPHLRREDGTVQDW